MKKLKKKNPQDATLRNIRALKERVDKIEAALRILKAALIFNLKQRAK